MEKNSSLRPVPFGQRHLQWTVENLFPLVGLGFDIAKIAMLGIHDSDFLAALAPVTLPPTCDLGVKFDLVNDWYGLWSIGVTLNSSELPPDTSQSEPEEMPMIAGPERLVWCMPVINRPGSAHATLTEDDWVHGLHFKQLVQHVQRNPGCLDRVPEGWPPRPRSIGRRIPVAPPEAVWIGVKDVKRFCHFFPKVAARLWGVVTRGSVAGEKQFFCYEANDRASEFLGIEIDLRHGFLFPVEQLDRAVGIAMCDADVVNSVPLVAPAYARAAGHPALIGACWSYTLNRALNGELPRRSQSLAWWVARRRPREESWRETCRAA